jgi:hypothetical protein
MSENALYKGSPIVLKFIIVLGGLFSFLFTGEHIVDKHWLYYANMHLALFYEPIDLLTFYNCIRHSASSCIVLTSALNLNFYAYYHIFQGLNG